MRTLDRLSIYALSLAIVGLVIVLIWQKAGKTDNTGEIAPLSEEQKAFTEHLDSLNKTLNETSKTRRDIRLGDKIK